MATKALISIPPRDDDRGLNFTRAAIALGRGAGKLADSVLHAEREWGANSVPAAIVRAIAGTSQPDSPGWGSELVTQAATEFFETVKSRTVLGQLVGLRNVPLATRFLAITGGATASWVGELVAKPITNPEFGLDTLAPLKLIAQAVATDELLRLSGPVGERLIRDDLARAAAEEMDAAFIDPGNAGSDGVTPASITYGAPSVAYADSFSSSFAALIDAFTGNLATAYLVADPVFLASLPSDTFPDVGARGGEIRGIPTLSTSSLPHTDSPQTHTLALIDPARVAYAEGETMLEASREGTLALIDEAGGEGALVSLWQKNLAALRAERWTNWKAIGSGAVVLLTGVPRGVSE